LLALPVLLVALVGSAAMGWHPFPWTVLLLPLALIPWLLLTGGVALATAALSVHFRDLRDLVSHVLNLLFFSSPIIYSLEGLEVPGPLLRLLHLNPMVSVVEVYRDLAFGGTVAGFEMWLLAMAVAIVAWWLGAAVFTRLRETLVEAV
jgi:lipopolysaccharide transport system permease protein